MAAAPTATRLPTTPTIHHPSSLTGVVVEAATVEEEAATATISVGVGVGVEITRVLATSTTRSVVRHASKRDIVLLNAGIASMKIM
jgi:hypothetical protein